MSLQLNSISFFLLLSFHFICIHFPFYGQSPHVTLISLHGTSLHFLPSVSPHFPLHLARHFPHTAHFISFHCRPFSPTPSICCSLCIISIILSLPWILPCTLRRAPRKKEDSAGMLKKIETSRPGHPWSLFELQLWGKSLTSFRFPAQRKTRRQAAGRINLVASSKS